MKKLVPAFLTVASLSACGEVNKIEAVYNAVDVIDAISNPIGALVSKDVNPAVAELIVTYDNSEPTSKLEQAATHPLAQLANPLSGAIDAGLSIRDSNQFDVAALAMARMNNDIDGIVYHEFKHNEQTIAMYGIWTGDGDAVIRGKGAGFNQLPESDQRVAENFITDLVKSEIADTTFDEFFDQVSCRAHNLLELKATQKDITSVTISPTIQRCDF